MSGIYLGEIIALVILIAGIFVGLTGSYILLRHFHRKWYWDDEVRKNALLKDAMRNAGIGFEVGPDGFVRPIDTTTRTSGRAQD